MVWTDTPALRGRGFELLLDYNWIKKGQGYWCYVAPGLLGHCNRRLQLVPKLSSVCGCWEWLLTSCSCFPVSSSPGDISSEE